MTQYPCLLSVEGVAEQPVDALEVAAVGRAGSPSRPGDPRSWPLLIPAQTQGMTRFLDQARVPGQVLEPLPLTAQRSTCRWRDQGRWLVSVTTSHRCISGSRWVIATSARPGEVLHELRGAQRPTRRLATGLRATRAPISERPVVVSRTAGVPNCCANSKGARSDDRPTALGNGSRADGGDRLVQHRACPLPWSTVAVSSYNGSPSPTPPPGCVTWCAGFAAPGWSRWPSNAATAPWFTHCSTPTWWSS